MATTLAEAIAEINALTAKYQDFLDGVSPQLVADGTVDAPSRAFISDVDTGTWRPGTNIWAVSTLGIKRLQIDAAGLATFTGIVKTTDATDATAANTGALQSVGGLDVRKTGIFGTGIKLGGVAAANLMDDYEEGTWTPIFSASGVAPDTLTYSTQVGNYTKIGRMVIATFDIRVSAFTLGSGTGIVRLDGLPFTAAVQTASQAGVGGFSGWTSGRQPEMMAVDSGTIVARIFWVDATSAPQINLSDLTASTQLFGTLVYYA